MMDKIVAVGVKNRKSCTGDLGDAITFKLVPDKISIRQMNVVEPSRALVYRHLGLRQLGSDVLKGVAATPANMVQLPSIGGSGWVSMLAGVGLAFLGRRFDALLVGTAALSFTAVNQLKGFLNERFRMVLRRELIAEAVRVSDGVYELTMCSESSGGKKVTRMLTKIDEQQWALTGERTPIKSIWTAVDRQKFPQTPPALILLALYTAKYSGQQYVIAGAKLIAGTSAAIAGGTYVTRLLRQSKLF